MYSREATFTIRYKDIELECQCTLSKTHYDYMTTSIEDVVESLDAVYHKGENITELISDDDLSEIWEQCYIEYYE